MRNRPIVAGAGLLAVLFFAAPRLAVSQDAAPLAPDTSWVHRSALYEVFVKDFSPQGNLRGVTRGLDRIVASGATVIWLMPLQPTGVVDRKGTFGSPYAIRDYMAIDPALGTRADLRALVRAAHAKGLKVILDWVPDHTSPDAVWVRQHPDFYVRGDSGQLVVPRDPQGHPTDWTDVVQLDYTKPALRAAMTNAMRRWLLDYDLDGFRVDVAHFIPLDYWAECTAALRRSVRHPIMMLAEAGELAMHRSGFDLTYSWGSYARLKEVWRGRRPASFFAASEVPDMDSMPPGGMRMRFTTNHDETAWDNPPVILFGGAEGARAAYVAAALLPGRPLLYNGQEVESPQKLRLFERDTLDWNQPGADSARAFYRRVIMMARTDTMFTRGSFAPLTTSADSAVIAYRRGSDGGAIVLVNARNAPVTFTITGASPSGLVNQLSGQGQTGDTVSLAAYGTAVLERPRHARVRIWVH